MVTATLDEGGRERTGRAEDRRRPVGTYPPDKSGPSSSQQPVRGSRSGSARRTAIFRLVSAKLCLVSATPSVSYSITVRLEVPAGGTAVSQLTTAVEQAGGSVTALDVTASGHERLRIDVTVRRPGHRRTPTRSSRRCAAIDGVADRQGLATVRS